jgi:hypothetical protein
MFVMQAVNPPRRTDAEVSRCSISENVGGNEA